MTKIKTAEALPGTSRNPVLLFRILLLIGAVLLIGGAVWYVAITGIIGRNDWDFTRYGLAPTLTAALGGGTSGL